MIDLDPRVGNRRGEGSLFPRPFRRSASPQDESAFDGPDGVGLVAVGHEIPGVEGKDALERFAAPVGQPVFEARNRQAGTLGVARLKRAPTDNLGSQRNARVFQRYGSKGESSRKTGGGEPRQAIGRAARAVAGVGPAKNLAGGHGSFQEAGGAGLAAEGDRGEDAGLVEDFRFVAERDMGQGARAFEADHAGANAPHREGHLV